MKSCCCAGLVAAKGPANLSSFGLVVNSGCKIPQAVRAIVDIMLGMVDALGRQIALLDQEITRRAKEKDASSRLMTNHGIGPITATALSALAPAAETFRKGRDRAAWLDLTPLQKSTGGKQNLGTTSKIGERTLRRLLIIGASALVHQIVLSTQS